ncbi:MAG: neutral zinc metallopeptidase [Kutzneria sp.]|nr:neutral zinc metallopeptidase [Kutzneria sp.]
MRCRDGICATALSFAMITTACTAVVTPGTAVARDSVLSSSVDPSFVHGTDGGDTDRLAATAITDIQAFWRESFPTLSGGTWTDLSGGVFSADTIDQKATPPPCTGRASEIEGNAFYCARSDSIAWDRASLLPVLRDRFGDAAVVLVLAHEMGHAVQSRSGLTPEVAQADPRRYPTILVETMADCYAGAFVRSVTDGKSPHLRIDARQLDRALSALVSFRDPAGTPQSSASAHGDAFDRVSAFQDGYQQGTRTCFGMTVTNQRFTQRGFASGKDLATGGNLTLADLLGLITPDLRGYFGRIVVAAGRPWTAPPVTQTDRTPTCSGADQGPAAFCADRHSIVLGTRGDTPALVSDIGDYAIGTLVASRFGLAALAALGKPVRGADAGRQAVCLAGSYTASLLASPGPTDLTLTPGDLDEAVQLLLGHDFAARDVAGHATLTGFARVSAFRAGFREGHTACGV